MSHTIIYFINLGLLVKPQDMISLKPSYDASIYTPTFFEQSLYTYFSNLLPRFLLNREEDVLI